MAINSNKCVCTGLLLFMGFFLALTTVYATASMSVDSQRLIPNIEEPQPTPPSPVNTQVKPRGQLLYENHCQVCHTSTVHVRKDRHADSTQAIGLWVTHWSSVLNLNWDDDEINAVVQYLNMKFYKFNQRP